MKRTELITRTGLGRGRLLNGVGENITDDPDGAGNRQVGTFNLDFSGLFQDEPLGGDGALPNLTAVDNEFTVVLADARGLDGDDLGDDNDLLSDATDPEEEDGAFITDDVQWAQIDRITVDWRFIGPSFTDAGVWSSDPETGEIENFQKRLDAALDDAEAALQEVDGDADVWSRWRSHLRWTLHWAVMVIDCVSVQDQGIADHTEANSTLSFRNNPVPVGGPGGLLTLYGSSTDGTNGIRLWQPTGGTGVRIVARGERELKYQYRRNNNSTDPAAAVDFDVLMPEDGVETPYRIEDASSRVEGNNVHLNLTINRRIRVFDDQLVVLCVQTGRARLAHTDSDPPGVDLIIAGPEILDGKNGPMLRMYHHYTQVSGTVR